MMSSSICVPACKNKTGHKWEVVNISMYYDPWTNKPTLITVEMICVYCKDTTRTSRIDEETALKALRDTVKVHGEPVKI